ncbi:glycosyltransferase 87 family protein [Massilia sp. BJB1822]|uniref:glycosyltransferase 87 family protein n=1 Tax=Massilia sp. BJB1822 TaxID=2744470 RepID=UPI00159333F7|nr:glycosyltransferase 87 family protein [Massilia sp. BJB1822]NVE01510.1 hypothetical protein [Massilia sp. BJB1822]
MRFLSRPLLALEAWAERRSARLNRPAAPLLAAILVPLLCGLLSLAMGQDDGWDMRNYHLYNVYALLNGRVGGDISAAGFQSYFNPTLDIPYYLLTQWLPAPLAGFAFGVLHGLNFLLVLGIARQLLSREAVGRPRLALLLAMAGMLGAGFLSELGNSMGDNMTALLVLAAVYLLLRGWDALAAADGRAVRLALFSGLLMGFGAGLKLTNATYALALCLAFIAIPTAFWRRVRLAFVFGLGVLAGMAATAGWWMFKMWQLFGNPLYPQFNNIFHSPLAMEGGVLDTGYVPKNLGEALLWPFIFTAHVSRVAEVPLKQLIWPIVYLLFIGFAGVWLYQRLRRQHQPRPLGSRAAFVLLFFALSYLFWLKLFGIYRYLIPIELLAPVATWLLLQRLFTGQVARRWATGLLAIASLAVLPFVTWGHAGWAGRAFSAQVPAIAKPETALLLNVVPHPPMAWMAQFFPPQMPVVALGTSFQETPAYLARIEALIASRPGPHYVMLPAARNEKEPGLQKKIALARALGWTDSAAGCTRLEKLSQRVRLQAQYRALPAPDSAGQLCTLELLPKHQVDLAAQDRATRAFAQQRLPLYRLQLDEASCRGYEAWVGADRYPYQLCRVTAPR